MTPECARAPPRGGSSLPSPPLPRHRCRRRRRARQEVRQRYRTPALRECAPDAPRRSSPPFKHVAVRLQTFAASVERGARGAGSVAGRRGPQCPARSAPSEARARWSLKCPKPSMGPCVCRHGAARSGFGSRVCVNALFSLRVFHMNLCASVFVCVPL